MNKVVLMGRAVRDAEVRYNNNGDESKTVARYTLAVDRRRGGDNNEADFINCVAWGKAAEFAGKYIHRGTKMVVSGKIQTGSYTNRDGQKVYTTEVVVDDQEFAESKSANEQSQNQQAASSGMPVNNPANMPVNNQAAPMPTTSNPGIPPVSMPTQGPGYQQSYQQGYQQTQQNMNYQQGGYPQQNVPNAPNTQYQNSANPAANAIPGFMNIPNDVGGDGLPFN